MIQKKRANIIVNSLLVAGNLEKSNQFLEDYYKIVDYAEAQTIIL